MVHSVIPLFEGHLTVPKPGASQKPESSVEMIPRNSNCHVSVEAYDADSEEADRILRMENQSDDQGVRSFGKRNRT